MARSLAVWLLGAAATAVTTFVLLLFRAELDKAHIALLYLLLVLGGSVLGGRRLGLTLAAAAFLLFDWFFLPPYNTLVLANPIDWLVLIAFLVVSGVAAQIVHRLREEATEARRRTEEVDRLAAVGAEALNVAPGEEALAAITEMIRSTLGAAVARIHPAPSAAGNEPDLVAWVGQSGRPAVRLADGTTRLSEGDSLTGDLGDARAVLLPLRVRGRVVGVLELASDRDIALDSGQRHFLTALGYYAALGVERVRLETLAARAEALREADRLKDAFIASVSHDLRTPLTTIKAFAEQLAATGDDRALAIAEEADRLNRLVADLLEISRIKSGTVPPRIELHPVDDLVGGVLQRLAGALGGREVKVEMPEASTLLVGRFDLGEATRILVNLIDNANKYSPPGPPVELTVAAQGERLVFEVLDRGPGVVEAERERIFEAFYQPPGRPPDLRGTGLGLAIARQLAERQGGTLTYAARQGGGSCFSLTLPAAHLSPEQESL